MLIIVKKRVWGKKERKKKPVDILWFGIVLFYHLLHHSVQILEVFTQCRPISKFSEIIYVIFIPFPKTYSLCQAHFLLLSIHHGL